MQTYPAPALATLTPTQLRVLQHLDVCERHSTPDRLSFHLTYCASPCTPAGPRPSVIVTLRPADGVCGATLRLNTSGRPPVDAPIRDQAQVQELVSALLEQAGITLTPAPVPTPA